MNVFERHSDFLNNYLSVRTTSSYARDLRDFHEFVNGVEPKNLKPEDFVKYRDKLIQNGMAPSTVCRKLASIKSFMKWLVREGDLSSDPSISLKLPRPSPLKPTEAFTDEEVKKLLAVPKSDFHQLILLMLLNTGIRRSELLNIEKSDVYTHGDHTFVRIKGKGGKTRDVPLNPSVMVYFRPHFTTLSSEIVFKLNPKTILRIVKRYAKAAGINKNVSPHSCRATLITKALEEGEVMMDVADLAGHSSVTTTQLYWRRRRGLDNSPVYKVSYG